MRRTQIWATSGFDLKFWKTLFCGEISTELGADILREVPCIKEKKRKYASLLGLQNTRRQIRKV